MDNAHADAGAARRHLAVHGWIARRAESFRHLPPPAAEQWLGTEDSVLDEVAARLDGWVVQQGFGGDVAVRLLDAMDPNERAELLGGLPAPGDDEAAPFAWAHRALVRHGLHVRIPRTPRPVCLQLDRLACRAVEAPLLVIELLPGAQAVLLETHGRRGQPPVVQNMQVHVRLAPGARLQHLRCVLPAGGDRVAHHLQVRLARDAGYELALLASGSAYHLQRQVAALDGEGASARSGAVLLASGSALEHQVLARHGAPRTQSAAEMLALASGQAHAVGNAHTHIAPGCDDADTRQKLAGIPTSGRPRIVLRPHLEIHHDQVQAAHGATWGALPEDALFLARQRGLDQRAAQALILEGLAQSLLARAVDPEQLPEGARLDGLLAAAVGRHLQPQEARHG